MATILNTGDATDDLFPPLRYEDVTADAAARRQGDIAAFERRKAQQRRTAELTLIAATIAAHEYMDTVDVLATIADAYHAKGWHNRADVIAEMAAVGSAFDASDFE